MRLVCLPRDEYDLVALSVVSLLVFEVVDGVPARLSWQLGHELVVVVRLRSLLDHNLLVVVRQLEDDVLGL